MLKAAFAGLALIGLVMAGFGIYFIRYGNEAGAWPEVQGTVVSAAVLDRTPTRATARTARQRDALREYYPSITYRWSVNGQTYTGSRYQVGATAEKSYEPADAQAVVDQFPAGKTVPVYYDPSDPSAAVLDRSVSGGVYVPLALGLLMLGCGAAGLRFLPRIAAASARSSAS